MHAHIDTVITKRIEHIEQVMQHNVQLELKNPVLQLNASKVNKIAKLD
jgi:hypothetical protein